jgi:prepilin signal peptidase PulO-like enzyme (type II secretory pathway)
MDFIAPPYPNLPMVLVSLLFFIVLVIAREIGAWLRRKVEQRNPDVEESDTFALSAVLGLLALLIGFTFSLALQRYDARRELVIAEANAIGTTWLRADLLEAGPRQQLRQVLRRYVDNRVAFGAAKDADEELRIYRQTTALQGELWGTVVAATGAFRTTPLASLLVSTTNDSIDLAASRIATRQAHIPVRIMRILVLYAVMAAGMVGYQQRRQRQSSMLMFVLITLAVALVIDLDNPAAGWISVPQTPMLDLQQSLD